MLRGIIIFTITNEEKQSAMRLRWWWPEFGGTSQIRKKLASRIPTIVIDIWHSDWIPVNVVRIWHSGWILTRHWLDFYQFHWNLAGLIPAIVARFQWQLLESDDSGWNQANTTGFRRLDPKNLGTFGDRFELLTNSNSRQKRIPTNVGSIMKGLNSENDFRF